MHSETMFQGSFEVNGIFTSLIEHFCGIYQNSFHKVDLISPFTYSPFVSSSMWHFVANQDIITWNRQKKINKISDFKNFEISVFNESNQSKYFISQPFKFWRWTNSLMTTSLFLYMSCRELTRSNDLSFQMKYVPSRKSWGNKTEIKAQKCLEWKICIIVREWL